MKNLIFANSLVLLLGGLVAPAAIAQDTPQALVRNSIDLNRAKNYARQAAERANGGLNNYRAEYAMHGPALEAPYTTNPNGSWTFNFTGTLFGPTPTTDSTVQTIVTVDPDGNSVRVEYNGPVR